MQNDEHVSLGPVSDEKIFNYVKASKWPSRPILVSEINRRIKTDREFEERVSHFEATYTLLKKGFKAKNITLEIVKAYLGSKNPILN